MGGPGPLDLGRLGLAVVRLVRGGAVEAMPLGRLRAGLLGLTGVGAEYLAALRAEEQLELVAVADSDPEVVRRAVAGTGVRGYEDFRSLIVEQSHAGMQLLLMALEPHRAVEFALLAAERGLAVFLEAPPARNLEEGQRLVQGFQAAGRPLVVSRPWHFEPAFALLRDLTAQAGPVHMTAAQILVPRAVPLGWRGDSVRAGGGVLLHGSYELLDLLVQTLGVPAQVWAHCSLADAGGQARSYDTEDGLVAGLIFAHGRSASLAAARCPGLEAPQWSACFAGARATVELTPKALRVSPGESGRPRTRRVRTGNRVAPALHAFVEAFRQERLDLDSAIAEHLTTLAVIDALYLSARTGAPESPARLPG